MPANRANFADALDPSFRKIYNEEYEKRPQMYTKVFNVGTSDKEFEKTSSITGFGLLSQVAEEGDKVIDERDLKNTVVKRHNKEKTNRLKSFQI